MNRNNAWSWVGSIVLVVILIGGLIWWFNGGSTATLSGTTASTTPSVASTTNGTTATSSHSLVVTNIEPAPVVIVSRTDKSIGGILAELTSDSTYLSLYNSTGIGATLGARGPYTVFVSTNKGYSLLKPGTISNMTATQKKRFIQYSIVSGRALDVNVQNSGSIKALSGDLLNFTVGSTGMVQVNSSFALGAFKASNGIVYIINQPLVPPTSGNILTP